MNNGPPPPGGFSARPPVGSPWPAPPGGMPMHPGVSFFFKKPKSYRSHSQIYRLFGKNIARPKAENTGLII